MKIILKTIVFCCFLAFGLGCEKKEVLVNNDPCTKGKLIYRWCQPDTELAVIKVLDSNIGGEFTTNGKTYQNAVLAHIELTLRKQGANWDKILASSDSVFYFRYQVKYPDFGYCEVGTPPKNQIRITSFISSGCPS